MHSICDGFHSTHVLRGGVAASTKREAQDHVFVFFQKVDRLSVEIVFSKGLVRNSNYIEYAIINYKRAFEFVYIFWDSSRHQRYLQVYNTKQFWAKILYTVCSTFSYIIRCIIYLLSFIDNMSHSLCYDYLLVMQNVNHYL